MPAAMFAFAASLAFAGAARADDAEVRVTLERAGLLGYWADKCQAPADEDNRWTTILPGRDGVVRSTETDGSWSSVYRVIDAERLPNGDVFMKMVWEGDGMLHDIVYRLRGDRYRIWSSTKLPAGHKLVVDGVMTSNGRPSSWSNRCPD